MGKAPECFGAGFSIEEGDGISGRNLYALLEAVAARETRRLLWKGQRGRAGRLKYKKNRASQSGGDRRARGIFELSTTVGLRRTSVSICTFNQDRNFKLANKEQILTRIAVTSSALPEILTA